MIRLVVRGPVRSRSRPSSPSTWPSGCRGALRAPSVDARVLGPAPAPFARLRGKYRFQIQVQGPDGERAARRRCAQATADLEPPDDVQWIVDVDPVDML